MGGVVFGEETQGRVFTAHACCRSSQHSLDPWSDAPNQGEPSLGTGGAAGLWWECRFEKSVYPPPTPNPGDEAVQT